MNDEWRLQIDVQDEGHMARLTARLDAVGLERQLSGAFHDRLIVSRDGERVFAYAATREQAEKAGDFIAELGEEHGWPVSVELSHWHPVAERWEDPDVPLPEDDATMAAEHKELMKIARRMVEEGGEPEFEVRVELPSHDEARRFARQLSAEDLPVVLRWRYLIVGAADEDEAEELTIRLEGEVPEGGSVTAEGSGKVAWGERPPNPFAIFGGLGG
jgi:nucleotide-binding universal stress UspA family protein